MELLRCYVEREREEEDVMNSLITAVFWCICRAYLISPRASCNATAIDNKTLAEEIRQASHRICKDVCTRFQGNPQEYMLQFSQDVCWVCTEHHPPAQLQCRVWHAHRLLFVTRSISWNRLSGYEARPVCQKWTTAADQLCVAWHAPKLITINEAVCPSKLHWEREDPVEINYEDLAGTLNVDAAASSVCRGRCRCKEEEDDRSGLDQAWSTVCAREAG